jgi:hypothetical protein
VTVAGGEDLEANVIRAGRVVLGDALQYRVGITPRDQAVD